MTGLIGRDEERGLLREALAAAPALVLVNGEAGAGKTRLIEDATEDLAVLRGVCSDRARSAYGPVLVALRGWLREHPDGFASLGSLRGPLSCLLPEAGGDPAEVDRGTLVEA